MPVTGMDITARGLVKGGQPFGEAGPYEYLMGTLQLAADPKHPANQQVCDIGLAPTGADGRVHFTADFYLLKPVQPQPGGRLFYDVVNRGNKGVMGRFNSAAGPDNGAEINVGDGFLMRHGFSVLWSGIESDIPPGRGGMGFQGPEAMVNGQRVTGPACIQFWPNQVTKALLLADRGLKPVPTADLNDSSATLTVREHHDAPAKLIDRSQWQFAKEADGKAVPDTNYAYIASGFQPGMVYELTYTAIGATLEGLGFVSMRDSVSFLKFEGAEQQNPLVGSIEYAYGFGASQTGRYVREFIYSGFNQDEAGRQVFDGVIAHIGSSRRGEFNFRFAEPSFNVLRAPGNLFPFTYEEQTDSKTGERGGLLTQTRANGTMPKYIALNSGMEYWWSGASLTHTDVDGKVDIDPPSDVRVYYMSGTQHGAGGLPLTSVTADGFKAMHNLNTVDYNPLVRAALLNLDRWVREGVEPPPNQYPRIDNGTAVPRESLESQFTRIPGAHFLSAVPQRRRQDYGPGMAKGQPQYPPKEGEPYGVLVSSLDSDSNEVAGVRMPDIRVPLASYAGWNARHADMGQPGLMTAGNPLFGSTWVFPRTKEEREAKGDPRPSIAERYASKDDYLGKVRHAAEEMARDRYILTEDIERCVQAASQRWDAFHQA